MHLDEFGVGAAIEDIFSFLSACPDLSRREYTWNSFKLCCFGLGHVALKLLYLLLRSRKFGVTGVDL